MAAGLAAAIVVALGAGCEPHRVEFHRRPAYYAQLTEGPLPDRVVLDDGTVLVYSTADPSAASASRLAAPDDEGKKNKSKSRGKREDGEDENVFRIRDEDEEGNVTLRALLPGHVIANLLSCLRLEEYELAWDQILSRHSREAYETEGQGFPEFRAYLVEHRVELAKMLNRMRMGLSTHEVVVENVGNGVVECRFWPNVAPLFRYKRVRMIHEDYGLKLLIIR